jgi:hypothetical protein
MSLFIGPGLKQLGPFSSLTTPPPLSSASTPQAAPPPSLSAICSVPSPKFTGIRPNQAKATLPPPSLVRASRRPLRRLLGLRLMLFSFSWWCRCGAEPQATARAPPPSPPLHVKSLPGWVPALSALLGALPVLPSFPRRRLSTAASSPPSSASDRARCGRGIRLAAVVGYFGCQVGLVRLGRHRFEAVGLGPVPAPCMWFLFPIRLLFYFIPEKSISLPNT